MIDRIRNKAKYNQVMALIEGFIKKATEGGGFNSLPKTEAEELSRLGSLAEQYEYDVLKLMPLPVIIKAVSAKITNNSYDIKLKCP